MNKLSTALFAATIAVASTAASAWGWGDNGYNNYNGYNDGYGSGYGDGDFDGDFGFSMNMSGRGSGRGYGNGYNGYRGNNGYGYGNAPYGYAPYGAAPAVEMTEEQQKAMADQQAKHIENMQKAQQQAAEFYANQRAPMTGMPADRMAQRDARIAEMDARMEEHRKAAETRAPMMGMSTDRTAQKTPESGLASVLSLPATTKASSSRRLSVPSCSRVTRMSSTWS